MTIVHYFYLLCFSFGFKPYETKNAINRNLNMDHVISQRYITDDQNVDVRMVKEKGVVHLIQENTQNEKRGSWSNGNDVIPFYYEFLLSINGTPSMTRCNGQGYSCVTFPKEITSYFANIGQDNLNNLGTFLTTPVSMALTTTSEYATQHVSIKSEKLSAYILKFKDPEWRKQWYMQDYRTNNYPVMDHNVVPVFNMKITGKGVTVAIVGEGIADHPDLGSAYDTQSSYDLCRNKKGAYPDYKFAFDGNNYDTDGTSNAGVISMRAGNGICGVGIAPDARIVGYKVTGCQYFNKPINAAERALKDPVRIIDIFCNVWLNYLVLFKDDFGNQLFTPTKDAIANIKDNVVHGRDGKGAIQIFPSGQNRQKSNCATNGYLNNRYVITVASATQGGKPAPYSERCSAIFATAYSGGPGFEDIATINSKGQCSTYFSDRPAAPAIASGIIALVLQAQPSLTYRDVMHIIAMTAEVAPLANNDDTWYRNGRGYWVSSDFGFGLLNAENMVNLAKQWKNVPPNNICLVRDAFVKPLYFDHKSDQQIKIKATNCNLNTGLQYLEHVKLEVHVKYQCRGAIYLDLTSPAGTKTRILEPRLNDCTQSMAGYTGWTIISVHNWGENPNGIWTINVGAIEIKGEKNPHGYFQEYFLKLYGIDTDPSNYPRKYASFRLPDGKTSELS